MTEDDESLEDYWADVKPAPLVEVVRTRGSDLDSLTTLAAEQTMFDLTTIIRKKYKDSEIAKPETIAEIVGTAMRLFMTKWKGLLVGQDLTGLIEMVLEGQQLKADEINAFVRALPLSILERIAKSALGSATGTHALMSLECLRRRGAITYNVVTVGTRIRVESSKSLAGTGVEFYLDEAFTLPNDASSV